jgi:oligopeptide transport system substrate-binding protein
MIRTSLLVALFGVLSWLTSGDASAAWNNPHARHQTDNVRYAAFANAPKTLDPARAYSSDEIQILAQIYEPLLQYHYLKRPYQLTPLTTCALPSVTYYDAHKKRLPNNALPQHVHYSVYDIYLKPNIYYQPHPALAKDQAGHYVYFHLTPTALASIHSLEDFKKTGTRRMTAADYAYQIKRLASPKTSSPIFGVMKKYIVGLSDLSHRLQTALKTQGRNTFLDLRQYPLSGVEVVSPDHLRITIHGYYPQFQYWLAMTFFVPIPWEADAFYSQPGLNARNITLGWYPIGTGPYRMMENNPNKQMVLVRNPNFHHERYPSQGAPGDAEKGYLKDAGKRLPFVDKAVFSLDKESIPRWNKFLQGYYDKSGIGSESFDQAIRLGADGVPHLTQEMVKKGIRLTTTMRPSLFYLGFNMLDPVVGGYSEKQRKLRQAISIALDYEEFITIFLNGRGKPAQGPIPQGIFGYVSGPKGMNPYVYTWSDGKPKRRALAYAKQLLAEAGYPGGIDPRTGQSLILHYDVATSPNPDDKARFNWFRKQFAKLGITLNIRGTLYNRFRDKVKTGKAQLFSWGWMADYPDPENFLFLLYGPNGKVKHGGENASNYNNPVANQLFEQIKNLRNGDKRQALIDAFVRVVQKDSPLVWGYHPIDFTLSHQWNRDIKPNAMANNTLKYEKIDTEKRAAFQIAWNQPRVWPLWLLGALLLLLALPLCFIYWRRERRPAIKRQ